MKKILLAASVLALAATACSQNRGGNRHVVNQTYVHKYGVEVTEEDWVERGKNGQVVVKLDDGVVVCKNYVGGQLEGEASYTFPHSDQIALKETYVGGLRTSELAYSLGGNPKSETQYESDEEKKVTSWFEDGTPESTELYVGGRLEEGEYYNPDHKVQARVIAGAGLRLVRDDYGQLVAHDTIDDGLLAVRTTFHPTGAPKEIFNYINDKIEGTVKRFHPAGEPQTIEQWVGGKQQGITTVFQNGEKYAEVLYLQGVKQGIEKRFRDNGATLVEEITWSNNQRHGPTHIHLDGVVRTEWFYKGANVSKSLYDLNVARHGY